MDHVHVWVTNQLNFNLNEIFYLFNLFWLSFSLFRPYLGMRFALVQCKAAISSLIKSFRIELHTKTQQNYKLDAKSFLALHAGGVWLDFENRLKPKLINKNIEEDY